MAKHAGTELSERPDRWKGSIANKYQPPSWSRETKLQWEELYYMLHDELFNSNWSATARALGIRIPTAKAWYTAPPKRIQELDTLRRAVKSVIRYMSNSSHKKYRDIARDAYTKLRRLKLQQELADDLEVEVTAQHYSATLIVSAIAWTAERQMPMKELLKTGNLNGMSPRQARRIITDLNLPRTVAGFGEEKQTWVSIPHPTDL